MSMVAKISIVGALAAGCFLAGMQHFAHQIRIAADTAPARISAIDGKAAAIVVVTGSGGRIEAGFNLLVQDQADRMLISGTGAGVSKNDILRIASGNPRLDESLVRTRLECCVDLGRAARNTRGNASETIDWVRGRGINSIILVTSDFHMPRALVEFRRLMPGYTVTPYPVPTRGLGRDQDGITQWWQSGNRLLTVSTEYGKYLASLIG